MVIRRLTIALIFTLLAPTAFATGTLDVARQQMASGQIDGALASYKQIDFSSPDWPAKVEDLVRLELRRGNALEAWRSLQVAKRVRKFSAAWSDYERLAIFLAGSCPLATEPFDKPRSYLLNAAIFRFSPSFFTEDVSVPLEHDPSESALVPGLNHYLAEIPHAELRRDSGCRAAKIIARTRKTSAANELYELRNFLGTLPANDNSQAKLLVKIRALELATSPEVNDTGLAENLRESLPKIREMPWNEFPDPERQWLFVQLFKARNLKEVAPELREDAENIARSALDAPGASPLWIALINIETESAKERVGLLSKVEKLGSFQGRAWLLFELARSKFEENDVVGSLSVLRRLLVEREEPVEGNLEDACINLASLIFAENRLDSKNLGAIEAALPARLWNIFFKNAEFHAAMAGRSVDFKVLEDLRRRRSGRDFGEAEETPILRALAERNLKEFRRELASSSAGAGRPLVSLARGMAGELVGTSNTSARPFSEAVAKKLQSLRFVSDEEERSDLVQLLTSSSAPADGRIAGAKSVRQGVLHLGTARWTAPNLRPADLTLQPPSVLPRRELYFIPDPAAIRGWIFSTEKR